MEIWDDDVCGVWSRSCGVNFDTWDEVQAYCFANDIALDDLDLVMNVESDTPQEVDIKATAIIYAKLTEFRERKLDYSKLPEIIDG